VIEGERRVAADEAEPGADRFAGLSADEFPTLSRFSSRYAARDSDESTRYGLDLILSALTRRTGPTG
jgi:hypothetical protein